MKGSEAFKTTIKTHLDTQAEKDPLFAQSYASQNKNLDDCCTYIFNQVQKSGCNGFADEEIFGMAMHYYDEANIKIGKPITSGSVIVNHVVEKPAPDVSAEVKALPKKKADKKKPESSEDSLFSLFATHEATQQV